MKELYSPDVEKVSSAMEEIFQDEQKYKMTWANQAKIQVAFANGDQNPYPVGAPIMVNNQPVNYSQTDSRMNMYQTNEIEPIMRTLISYMTRSKPDAQAEPAGDDPVDKNVARLSERVNEAKYFIDNEYDKSKKSAFWSLSIGTVFRKDYWDYSLGNYLYDIDENGNRIIDPQTGEPVLQETKSGNNSTAILTPFSVTVDHSLVEQDLQKQPYIGDSYIMDVEWARQAFDRNEPGYTGKADKIQEDGWVGDTLRILEDLKFSIPYVSIGGSVAPQARGKCLVREFFVAPNKTYQRGRYLIKAGGVIVYDSPVDSGSPYFMELEEISWHNYNMFQFEPYIGRFLGKSLVEQLLPLQMRLNEINGSILENANTLAKPNIMAAMGQLKKGIMNGKGANIYTYAVVPGAQPPFPLQGLPLPAQFFEERKMIIDEMVRIAGTNFVMQGNAPTGVTAASAISQLLENANNQQSDMMNTWADYHERGYNTKLRILHKFMDTPDKALTKYIRTLSRDALDIEIHDFVAQKDLSAGVNLKIEEGSMIPRSESVKTQQYQDLAKGGALGPAFTEDSPRGERLREQLMEKMGLDPLESDEATELKKAKWENERILKGLPVEVSEYDVTPIHLSVHIAKIQEPHFLETATDQIKLALDQHIQQHKQEDLNKQMQAQAQMAPPGGGMPPGIQAPPGAPPAPLSVPRPGGVPPPAPQQTKKPARPAPNSSMKPMPNPMLPQPAHQVQ